MLTSWHGLVAQADLRPGQTVLVQAAGSGVGSAAIQIARLTGARVIATVGSDDKIEFAKALGAERVVNYRTQDFVEEAKKWTDKRGVDVVVEHIGGDTFEASIQALTPLGELRTILDYIVAGRLAPVIDRAFPLEDARAAVQYVLDRKNQGKVLLIP